jgi:hypothetical protein
MSVTITTNNAPRLVIDGYQLTVEERAEFDYIDWTGVDGTDSATFFRFRGDLYDLGEFSTTWGLSNDAGLPDHLAGWHGYMSTSAFSAILVRYCENTDYIVVGTALS